MAAWDKDPAGISCNVGGLAKESFWLLGEGEARDLLD